MRKLVPLLVLFAVLATLTAYRESLRPSAGSLADEVALRRLGNAPFSAADVHAIEDHISCDARSRSEIVVPVRRGIHVRCILDVDSTEPNAFGEHDRAGLERICTILARAP